MHRPLSCLIFAYSAWGSCLFRCFLGLPLAFHTRVCVSSSLIEPFYFVQTLPYFGLGCFLSYTFPFAGSSRGQSSGHGCSCPRSCPSPRCSPSNRSLSCSLRLVGGSSRESRHSSSSSRVSSRLGSLSLGLLCDRSTSVSFLLC